LDPYFIYILVCLVFKLEHRYTCNCSIRVTAIIIKVYPVSLMRTMRGVVANTSSSELGGVVANTSSSELGGVVVYHSLQYHV